MSEKKLIKMPQLSDTMTEGVLVSWEREIGDKVSRGDIVATVETDKAIMDVEVFREGYLSGPRIEVNSTVPVGDAIACIVASSEEVIKADDASVVNFDEKESGKPDLESTEPVSTGENELPDSAFYTIKMPQLSDTMTEGMVVEWVKSPGDTVSRGDIVAQVETDKAIMDVEVFRDGYLSGPIAAVDSVISVGGAIAYLVKEKAEVSADTALAQDDSAGNGAVENVTSQSGISKVSNNVSGKENIAPRPKNKKASPYARKLAGQFGVDLNKIAIDGVITAEDVKRYGAPSSGGSTSVPSVAFPEVAVPGNGRPMTAMEKAISQNMTASLTMPTFSVTVNANPGLLISAAKSASISVTVAIAKACALAIQDHPKINWAYQQGNQLIERSQVDIGMAVAADDGGLVVPVLRACESTSLSDLGDSWGDLVSRARTRKLKPDEFSNPTFMVSNMGMLGVTQFQAIPTPGIAAILAISALGEAGMPLTITADHRVVNGAQVALFLNSLKGYIEQPGWLATGGPIIPQGDWDYDVVVIGGGPGGEDCARDLVGQGLKVAMVNDAPFPGGECLWRGCIPSKAWRAAADRIKDRESDLHLGVEGSTNVGLNWDLLEKTRKNILETRGKMALNTDKGVKIDVIQGFASFISDHKIVVDKSANLSDPFIRAPLRDGSNQKEVTFGCAVIATGAPPYVPPIPGVDKGLDSFGVLTSDTVWSLEKVPEKMVVIGAGAIGVEMAQIFHDFGSEVVLLEVQDRILAEVESEVASHLTKILNDQPRLDVLTAVRIEQIKGSIDNMSVQIKDEHGVAKNFSCNRIILATGKRPDLKPLKLEQAKIAVNQHVIKTDLSGRTSIPHIYAVGDVIGGLMLAHTAGQQGRIAAENILGGNERYHEDKDCGVIFTRPQAAFVGLSVAQAKEKGIDAVEIKVPMSIDAKAMISNETEGLIKIVADKQSQKIIGVHLLADHADTLIGEAVLMVSAGLSLHQVATAIHPHPTQTELFGDLARRLLSRLNRALKAAAKRS